MHSEISLQRKEQQTEDHPALMSVLETVRFKTCTQASVTTLVLDLGTWEQ